jgi:hypothetical protein
MTSVFLSYARGDDAEPFDPAASFVARLYGDLKAAGFDVWFDRQDMPSRSLTFHQEIRDAIAARERLLLIVGPKAVTSDYVRQEWQFARREAEKVVTPILRLGDYLLVPDELKLLHCEDFRDDTRYSFHLDNLIRQLREPAPTLGKLIAVPSLPAHYLQRSERLIVLRDALRADLDRPVVIGGAAARVGMHGMGGIGKSVLASALAHDRRIREAFSDGIVWIGVGSLPDVPALMRRVHRDLGGDGAIESEHDGKTRLKELLVDKAVLLILDDVWRRSDVDCFDVLGSRCRALITTRDNGLFTALGGVHHVVELLTDQEALDVLALAVGVAREKLPDEAGPIIAECGRLPLAVALCGGLIRRSMPWGNVLEQLKQARIDRIADRHAIEPHHQSVWHTLHISVEFLRSAEKQRFLELAVFPPDEATTEAAVATLWAHTGGLDEWGAQELLASLGERSLVQLVSKVAGGSQRPRPGVALHDLVYDYVRGVAPVTPETHERLLQAYEARCPEGWASGPNDGYFFTHLSHHLAEAGRGDEQIRLLLDLPWLEAKTEAGYVLDLAMDFTRAGERLPADHAARPRLRLIEQALRSDLHFIASHPTTLFQCLWNRCWWYDCADANARSNMLMGEQPEAGRPWERGGETLSRLMEGWLSEKERRSPGFRWIRCLLPDAPGCDAPCCLEFSPDGERVAVGNSLAGAAEVWNLADLSSPHYLWCDTLREVTALAWSSDGRKLATGTAEGSVKVWLIDERELTDVTLEGNYPPVLSLAFSPDGRCLAIGSGDGTITVVGTPECQLLVRQSGVGQVHCVVYSPDGLRLAAGTDEAVVYQWDLSSSAEVDRFQGHDELWHDPDPNFWGDWAETSPITEAVVRNTDLRRLIQVAYSADGRRIASLSRDGKVVVRDTGDGRVLSEHVAIRTDARAEADPDAFPIGLRLDDPYPLRRWELIIRRSLQGDDIAWLPGWFEQVRMHPDGRTIGALRDDRFVLFRLEGSQII